jgi:RimJ/RimL family protein N-acetyltransferase
MNTPQAHLRFQQARIQYLQHVHQRRFDHSLFVPLETTHLWLCVADRTNTCHLSVLAGTQGVSSPVLRALRDDKLHDSDGNNVTWIMYHKDNPHVQIGSISLFEFSSTIAKIAEAWVGYGLNENFRGKGLMSEALGKVLGFAFEKLGLQRIKAKVRVSNERSKGVVKRAGFENVGIHRKGKWRSDEEGRIEVIETEVWLLKKDDWEDHVNGRLIATVASL